METAFRSDERFTQSEFLDWLDKRPPGDVNHYELLDGHVVTTPPASWKHSSVGANIVTELVLHARSTGTGRAFDATAGYGLPSGDVLEPDASFVSTATLPRDQSRQPDTFLRIVPDFVVEILSPSTSRRDRTEKKRCYARNGVSEYWIVDPGRRRVTMFRLAGDDYAPPVEVVGGIAESSALPGFSVLLEAIFADLD